MVPPSTVRQSKIVIFCGKGGVGKTTLSLGLALRRAEQGLKTVVVSSHPLAELAVAVSLEGLAQRFPRANKNLFVIHIDPKELLADVVNNNFPVDWVAKRVLDSSIYQNLIEVAPGLKEFYFLAHLQKLAERSAGSTPDFDLLFWDAPATGHFLSTLDAARNFETFLTGPLAEAGAELAHFFSNTAHITVLPTTTLEEMAITETVEMCTKLNARFGLAATALLMNLVSPMAMAPEAEVAEAIDTSKASSDPAVRFALDRGLIERERAAEVRGKIKAPAIAIERVRDWSGDLDLLDRVGIALEGVPLAA